MNLKAGEGKGRIALFGVVAGAVPQTSPGLH